MLLRYTQSRLALMWADHRAQSILFFAPDGNDNDRCFVVDYHWTGLTAVWTRLTLGATVRLAQQLASSLSTTSIKIFIEETKQL